MKTTYYNNFIIEPRIINKGNYYILTIEKVWIPDDKSESECSDVIIQFGNCFNEVSDIEKFQKTKFYKTVLKSTEKL